MKACILKCLSNYAIHTDFVGRHTKIPTRVVQQRFQIVQCSAVPSRDPDSYTQAALHLLYIASMNMHEECQGVVLEQASSLFLFATLENCLISPLDEI